MSENKQATARTVDTELAQAVPVMFPDNREAQAWFETAAFHHRNECYYRGLVVQIGKMLGDAAYISDDDSRQQDVLCAKVPELVRAMLPPPPSRHEESQR